MKNFNASNCIFCKRSFKKGEGISEGEMEVVVVMEEVVVVVVGWYKNQNLDKVLDPSTYYNIVILNINQIPMKIQMN